MSFCRKLPGLYCEISFQFLGAFAQKRKVTISFVVPVRSPPPPPGQWSNPALTVDIFMKFDIWGGPSCWEWCSWQHILCFKHYQMQSRPWRSYIIAFCSWWICIYRQWSFCVVSISSFSTRRRRADWNYTVRHGSRTRRETSCTLSKAASVKYSLGTEPWYARAFPLCVCLLWLKTSLFRRVRKNVESYS